MTKLTDQQVRANYENATDTVLRMAAKQNEFAAAQMRRDPSIKASGGSSLAEVEQVARVAREILSDRTK